VVSVPSATESYLSPTELADCPPNNDTKASTVDERPSADDEGSRSAVGTEVYLNKAFSDDTIPHQAIYANTTDSIEEDFVELY